MFLALYLIPKEPIIINVAEFKIDPKKHDLQDVHIVDAKRIIGFVSNPKSVDNLYETSILLEGGQVIGTDYSPYALYQAFAEAIKPTEPKKETRK